MRLPALLAPLLFAVLLFAAPVRAQDHGFGPAVSTERLDDLRGGFQLPGGLSVGFGLERSVLVNGQVVVAQSVQIPDLARITADQAQQLASLTEGQRVTVGGTTGITSGLGGLVIQNALDNQQIAASTNLHVNLNTLGLLQNLNFNSALTDAQRLGGP